MAQNIIILLIFFVFAEFLVGTVLSVWKISKRTIWFLFVGSTSFISVFLVQMPLQKLTSIVFALSPAWKALAYAAVAGFVQEFFKSVSALYPEGNSTSGFLTGTGFGLAEVCFILLQAPFISFMLVVERIFTLLFHCSSSGIVLYFKEKERFILGYILMSLAHTVMDFVAILFHIGLVSIVLAEAFAGAVSIFVFISFLFAIKKFTFKRKTSKGLQA